MKITGFNLINFKNNFLNYTNQQNTRNLPNSYYKLLNSDTVSFGKKKFDENFLKQVEENYKAKKSVKEFCDRKGVLRQDYYQALKYLKNQNRIEVPSDGKSLRTKELIQKVVENHEAGKPIKEFCTQEKISITYYYELLHRGGIRLRQGCDKNFLQKIKENYEAGRTSGDFRKQEGCSKMQYQYAMHKLGLHPREEKHQKRLALIEKIKANHAAGKSSKDFQEQEGLPINTYNHILKREFGIKPAEENKNKRNTLIQKAKEHFLAGKSIQEFCDEYKVGIRTFYSYLKQSGLVLSEKKDIEEIKKEKENAKSQQTASDDTKLSLIRFCRRKDFPELVKQAKIHYEAGKSPQEFCEKYLCSKPYYNYLLKKNNINLQLEETEELVQQIKENYEKGENIIRFCQKTGCSVKQYHDIVKKYGLKSLYDNPDFINAVVENFKAGRTAKQFKEKTGYSPYHYYNALRKLNLNPKDRNKNFLANKYNPDNTDK